MDFFRDDGPVLAGSITYFFLMTLVPFCLLLVSIFGYIIGEDIEFYNFLSARLMSFFPKAASDIAEELAKIITYKGIGIFTAFVYFYFSYQLYFALERSVNIVFGIKKKRRMLISVLHSLVFITSMILFVIVSFAATGFISVLEPITRYFPGLHLGGLTSLLIGIVIPFLLVFLSTSALYIVLPQKRIRLRNAARGGLFVAFSFEVVKQIFTFYVAVQIAHLGSLYGSLTTVVVLLLWIFYASWLFLIGAEIVCNLESQALNEA
jgi:membrane protein